jgi:ABC-type transport system involved in multi-copper enzyme maturation permease subunit
MVSLFRAEWQKTAGNRWAVGMLIWIFPAAAIGLSALAVVITLLSSDYREFMQQNYSSIPWNTRMIEMAGFLNNEIGRLIILAFTAIMFAGEYQYGTWKNLVPRRRRVALILTKFVTLAVFVTVSVIAFSIIATIGTGITAGIAGTDFGPAPTPEVIGQFLRDYLLQLGITLSATFIASGYAAVAAIITRNILGSLLVGFLFSMGETTVLLLTSLLYNVMKFPIEVMNVYLATPGYNLANISAWIKNDVGYAFRVTMDFSVGPFDIGVSILVIALWIVGAIALATFLFHRQDITV